ncbi:MAG TPA: single-stranded DNA-binding protein [Candidatus Ozemobacteraceae bacterium]|nr:single-stranded DNA-binding protein [Candidatus Ozemobacteraceae bacterium]
MAANLNRVFLVGNLTRDPELNYTPQGTAVGKFSIAVNRQYKGSDGEMKKQTDFFNIVVWGKTGETCKKFLTKGRSVLVEGRLQNRSYETQDKQKRTVTEIVADNVQFLGGSMGGGSRPDDGGYAGGGEPAADETFVDTPPGNDDVPF